MNNLSTVSLFQASLNVFTLSFLILWILALGECQKEQGGKCGMYLAWIILGLVLQIGFPLFNIYHTLNNVEMGYYEILAQNLWLINWHIFIASLLLFTGFLWLIIRTGIAKSLQTRLPIAIAMCICLVYTSILLVNGIV